MSRPSGMWFADDLEASDYDPPPMERGEAQLITPDDHYPSVQRPIGFVLGKCKPRVRVKAWTMPIIAD
jgi:hypothetical protein